MRSEASIVGRVHVHGVMRGRKGCVISLPGARFHGGDEFARDLRGFEIARKHVRKGALYERRARFLDPPKKAHRRSKRAT